MKAYENDEFVIPEEYKKMSVIELEEEQKKMLAQLLIEERPQKQKKTNKRNIVFNY